jgi:hypothetical protein
MPFMVSRPEATPWGCAGTCRGIEALPQDLLVDILASLERRGLRTARLVCRAFRAASIPCVTYLKHDCDTEMDDILGDHLLHCLRVFPCVVDRVLCGTPRSVVDMLREPGVLPRLQKLSLSGQHVWEDNGAASSIGDLLPLLPAATRLTNLEVLSFSLTSVKAAAHLARALAACPALEQVHIGSLYVARDVVSPSPLREVLGKRLPVRRNARQLAMDEHDGEPSPADPPAGFGGGAPAQPGRLQGSGGAHAAHAPRGECAG